MQSNASDGLAVGTGVASNQDMMRLILTLLSFYCGSTALAGDYRAYYLEKNRVNSQGDRAVISYFHTQHPGLAHAILDKKSGELSLVIGPGLESHRKVQASPLDELEDGAAGIYRYAGSKNEIHYGEAEKDKSIRALFLGEVSLPRGTIIYVLPSSVDHRFRIRNGVVTFNAARVLRERTAFNYSPYNAEAKPCRITVDLSDSFSQKYVETLQNEKPALMELLHLENDEYNMLAEFSFGVLAPETNFGRDFNYRLKQIAPRVVSVLKGRGLDVSKNSRGPTQIKTIPPLIIEKYGIDKSQLKYPENAAVATLGFAADLLKEIRNRAPQHAAINEETLQDYMYYLYQGRRGEIKNATATPDANISIRRIREAIELLHIEE